MSDDQLTVSGTLKDGFAINGEKHKDFVMREALARDFFSAERDATGDLPTTYRAAMIARQLVRVGTYEGPFTLSMLGLLKGKDLAVLMLKQQELDALGEETQPAAKAD